MASTTTTIVSSSSTTTTTTPTTSSASTTPATFSKALPRPLRRIRLPTAHRAAGRLAASVSTPNLGALFSSHAQPPTLPSLPALPAAPALPSLLARKASLAALTSSSLATIPDATESYAADSLTELVAPAVSPPSNSHDTTTATATATNPTSMPPLTPSGGRFAASMSSYAPPLPGPGDEVAVGDTVDVPGGMTGVVRFVGSVAGRKGVFAGVELHADYAARGKNNGDVDGVSYFNTSLPDAGIFLPLNKAVRRDSSAGSSFPQSPGTANGASGLKRGNLSSTHHDTPPTPSLPKFSQSVSGGGPPRAPSPQARRPPRTSLPRPDSPVRRLQMTPGPSRPSLATPAPKTSSAAPPGRFGSPTPNKFSQSMRAPPTSGAGDPSKRGVPGGYAYKADRKQSIGPRSASALGGASNYGDDSSSSTTTRPKTNGSGSGSFTSAASASTVSMGYGPRARSPSRNAGAGYPGHAKNGSQATEEELERLRNELDDRNRQLKDQANTLADMESSLTELQTLIESSDGPLSMNGGGSGGGGGGGGSGLDGDNSLNDKDLMQMRALLREKNEKIAMLTAEFDTHRADFRSTIDTLEMASTETERVYEKKIEELMQELQELENRLSDVNAMANQLKQLEEFVQELEEGLEDARRGEAEARSEVEFLHGEVERTRTELRREREKAAAMMANGGGVVRNNNAAVAAPSTSATGNEAARKDLEQKDDEIRGLKAIIHSLSQNAGVSASATNSRPGSWRAVSGPAATAGGGSAGAVGGGAGAGVMPSVGSGPSTNGTSQHRRGESINERLARERLEREVAELRTLLDTKASREVEMERELEQLRVAGAPAGASTGTNNNNNSNNNNAHRGSALTLGSRSSLRDSRGTVVLARDFRDAAPVAAGGNNAGTSNSARNSASASGDASGGAGNNENNSGPRSPVVARKMHHARGSTLDTMPESDAYSSVTEASTLWCEICETNGHDILTCTNMFGPQQQQQQQQQQSPGPGSETRTGKDVVRAAGLQSSGADLIEPLRPTKPSNNATGSMDHADRPALTAATSLPPWPPLAAASAAPSSAAAVRTTAPTGVPSEVKILPNPMEGGPVAGKESGVVDADKWCALCERDGHDSVDCPFEDAF